MHVNRILCRLSVLLKAFPEGIVDAGNKPIYSRLLHWYSCILGIFGYMFETAVLAKFVHVKERGRIL